MIKMTKEQREELRRIDLIMAEQYKALPAIHQLRIQKAKIFFAGIKFDFSQLPYPKTKIGTCKFCGEYTENWVVFYLSSKTCVCRDCKDKPRQTEITIS